MDWVIDEDSSAFDCYSGNCSIQMIPSGQWAAHDADRWNDAVCVLNVPPEACSICPNGRPCRYRDKTRTEVKCI